MSLPPTAVNEIPHIPTLRSLGTSDIDPNVKKSIKEATDNYEYFNTSYINKRDALLGFLNSILGKTYSFGPDGLPIESIFDETFNEKNFPNSDKICNAGRKAYAYYLKEVLQKLNLLNQHILKGKEALNALQTCTNESQIENYKTILEIQDELVKKYLDDFNKYTVVQTLSTTRHTIRNTIDNKPAGIPFTDSVEINYATRGKIWDENGNLIPPKNSASKQSSYIEQMLNEDLTTLGNLRNLKTIKETGFQSITTTLTNKHTEAITNLNDEFGFNVVKKTINASPSDPSPIALFDELTLLEKLKYICVYYHNRNGYPYEFYHYPEDLKSGVPCMSRAELEEFVHDTNTSEKEGDPEGNNDELEALGIMPSEENKPKTDLVEPGAIELFYVGYLKDSMGTINALAAFMEIKSVSLMTQITQQSYRIKALKTYLKMLEFGLQELNNSFKGNNAISPKAYLAIKYAAANQTRTLVNINGEDYIVFQLDRNKETDENKETGDYEHYNLSDNNAYIYVKATDEGINEFLEIEYTFVDGMFNSCKEFKDLSDSEIITANKNGTRFYYGASFSGDVQNYDYLHENATKGDGYTISVQQDKDGGDEWYKWAAGVDQYSNYELSRIIKEKDSRTDTERMIWTDDHWENLVKHPYRFYQKNSFSSDGSSIFYPNHILFAKFEKNNKETAEEISIQHLPKELETSKVKMDDLLKNFGNTSLNWRNATLTKDEKDDGVKKENIWPKLVEMWQNVCQTAIENIGSQIESVNKTIKSLRSKIDTFDSSANRFRDKFYSTTMTVLNKLS